MRAFFVGFPCDRLSGKVQRSGLKGLPQRVSELSVQLRMSATSALVYIWTGLAQTDVAQAIRSGRVYTDTVGQPVNELPSLRIDLGTGKHRSKNGGVP